MPLTYLAFMFGSISIIGMPPLGGFISKWNLAIGAVNGDHLVLLAVLLISSLLNAAYFLPIVYRGYFATASDPVYDQGIKEARFLPDPAVGNRLFFPGPVFLPRHFPPAGESGPVSLS